MSIFSPSGRGESKPNPWAKPPTETGTPIINAPTAAEVVSLPNAKLTVEQMSERFEKPLKYEKGGEVAIHGALQAGTVHAEYQASQSSVEDHPSNMPEEATQSQEVA